MNENVKSENKDKANKTKATKGNKRNNKPKISFIAILKKNLIKFRNWLRENEPFGVLIAVVTLIFSLILGIIQIIQFQEERSLRKQQFSEWQEQRKEWKEDRDLREKQFDEWEADRDLRKQQFSEWQEERKARAWQILTTRAIGNSGKKEALEFLASQKTALTGIDLSCTTNNGKWDDKNKECDPAGVYLRELDLSEDKHGHKVELRNSKFEGAFLDDASFDGAILWEARFDGADLSSASFDRARFDGAVLEYASFDGANLYNASFDGALLDSASFDGADLLSASFDGADLDLAKFDNANLAHASFDGADLSSASFDGANLWEARFDGADLEGASFDGANLWSARFDNAKYLDPEQLETAWMWANAYTVFLPKLPPDWNKSARDIILFCHPEISEKYYDDIEKGKRKSGLPDPDKCKKWHKWPEENRKNWRR